MSERPLLERLDERCHDGEGINVTKQDVLSLIAERDAVKTTFAQALMSRYDWEGATVPADQWQRGPDMPRFHCARCSRPLDWIDGKTPCPMCDPVRVLLREAIALARR